MKKTILFVILLSITVCSCSFFKRNIITYPKYESVVSKFFSLYNPEGVTNQYLIRFAKETDGWHVFIYSAYNELRTIKPEKDVIFWSAGEKKFMDLPFNRAEVGAGESKIEKAIVSDEMQVYHSNLYPYYGYGGWQKDVIQLLEGRDLNDSLLCALSGAYSNYAFNLFGEAEDDYYKSGARESTITQATIDSFSAIMNKCIAIDVQLEKKNPGFASMVGMPSTLHGNDCVDAWEKLLEVNAPDAAAKFLTPGLYQPAVTESAKDILSSCAPHAILITQKGIDNSQLLYVQQAMGFRKDITVINFNSLMFEQYVNMVRKKSNYGEPVEMSTPLSAYDNHAPDFIGYYNNPVINKDTYYNLKDVLGFVTSDKEMNKTERNGKMENYLPTTKLYIAVDKEAVMQDASVPADSVQKIVSRMEWTLPTESLSKNGLAVLDIIEQNVWKRPIYFPCSISNWKVMGLDGYLRSDGFAFRLVPLNCSSVSHEGLAFGAPVDVAVAYNNLMNNFSYSAISKSKFAPAMAEYDMVSFMRSQFYSLALALGAGNEKEKAMAVLKKSEEVFPPADFPFDLLSVMEVKAYYALGDVTDAEKEGEGILEKYSSQLEHFTSMAPLEKAMHKKEINEAVFALSELASASGKEKGDFFNKVKAALDKYGNNYVVSE